MLEQRGLVVSDVSAAVAFLGHLNYYRFSGYCLAFEDARHQFVPGTTFEQVHAAYEFDLLLRDYINVALEWVEIDIRTTIAHYYGEHHGAFGHIDPQNFFFRFNHTDWLDKLRTEADRSRELFVQHYRSKYTEFPDLPIWMATEIMSFGSLSYLYKGMDRKDQKVIARQYGIQAQAFGSWMHHLVYVRNLCAHHSRLWDRTWAIKPDLLHGKKWQSPLLPDNSRLFVTLLILSTLLEKCNAIKDHTRQWRSNIETLIGKLPASKDPLDRMGLTNKWNEHPCWGPSI